MEAGKLPEFKIIKKKHSGYGSVYFVYRGSELIEAWDYLSNARQHVRDLRNEARGAVVLRPINGKKII